MNAIPVVVPPAFRDVPAIGRIAAQVPSVPTAGGDAPVWFRGHRFHNRRLCVCRLTDDKIRENLPESYLLICQLFAHLTCAGGRRKEPTGAVELAQRLLGNARIGVLQSKLKSPECPAELPATERKASLPRLPLQ